MLRCSDTFTEKLNSITEHITMYNRQLSTTEIKLSLYSKAVYVTSLHYQNYLILHTLYQHDTS